MNRACPAAKRRLLRLLPGKHHLSIHAADPVDPLPPGPLEYTPARRWAILLVCVNCGAEHGLTTTEARVWRAGWHHYFRMTTLHTLMDRGWTAGPITMVGGPARKRAKR